jgi:hypothetical protein
MTGSGLSSGAIADEAWFDVVRRELGCHFDAQSIDAMCSESRSAIITVGT